MTNIAKRLRAAVKADAVNGSCAERAVCASLMLEAARFIESRESEIAALRRAAHGIKIAGPEASVKDVLDALLVAGPTTSTGWTLCEVPGCEYGFPTERGCPDHGPKGVVDPDRRRDDRDDEIQRLLKEVDEEKKLKRSMSQTLARIRGKADAAVGNVPDDIHERTVIGRSAGCEGAVDLLIARHCGLQSKYQELLDAVTTPVAEDPDVEVADLRVIRDVPAEAMDKDGNFSIAGECDDCGGLVFRQPGKPGEFVHQCDSRTYCDNCHKPSDDTMTMPGGTMLCSACASEVMTDDQQFMYAETGEVLTPSLAKAQRWAMAQSETKHFDEKNADRVARDEEEYLREGKEDGE